MYCTVIRKIEYFVFPFQAGRSCVCQNLSHFLLGGPSLRSISTTTAMQKVQSGRYKVTRDRSRPLTYEMANQPCQIAHRKSWNSWNTCRNLLCFSHFNFVKHILRLVTKGLDIDQFLHLTRRLI